MEKDDGRIIDMTLEGDFIAPPRPAASGRVMLWAITAIMLSVAALIVAAALWFVVMILPAILVMGAAGYLFFRYQGWRARQGVRWRGPGGWNR